MKRLFPVFGVLVFAFILRTIWLEADPPAYHFRQYGVYVTDEGWWTYGARHKFNSGTWASPLHWNYRYYISPVFSWLEYLSFKIWRRAGFVPARFVSALLGFLTVAMIFLLPSFSYREKFVSALFFAFNFAILSYNRLALLETTQVGFLILAFLFVLFSLRNPLYAVLSGIAVSFACFVKPNSLFIVFVAGYFLFPRKRQFSLYVTGTLVAFLCWLLFFVLPHLQIYLTQNPEISVIRRIKNDFKFLPANLSLFPMRYFYLSFPFLSFFTILFIWREQKIKHIEKTLLLWLLLAGFSVGYFHYQPLRYYFPMIPPLVFLSGMYLFSTKKAEKETGIFLPVVLGFVFTLVFLSVLKGMGRNIFDLRWKVVYFKFYLLPALCTGFFTAWSMRGFKKIRIKDALLISFLSYIAMRDFPYILLSKGIRCSIHGYIFLSAILFSLLLLSFLLLKRFPLNEKGAWVVAGLFFLFHFANYIYWGTHRQYTLYTASRKIGEITQNKGYIFGRPASTLTMENKLEEINDRIPLKEMRKRIKAPVYGVFTGERNLRGYLKEGIITREELEKAHLLDKFYILWNYEGAGPVLFIKFPQD